MNLITYLADQQLFSQKVFGPGYRTEALLAHITKEIEEVRKDPLDAEEWIDIVTLAFEGALRTGLTPAEVCKVLEYKLDKNKKRKWPDYRTHPENKPMEHLKNDP